MMECHRCGEEATKVWQCHEGRTVMNVQHCNKCWPMPMNIHQFRGSYQIEVQLPQNHYFPKTLCRPNT